MSLDKPLPQPTLDDHGQDSTVPADLSNRDLLAHQPRQFELLSKDKRVNMRMPTELLNAVKAVAERKGIRYQHFVRQALERALEQDLRDRADGIDK